MPRPANVSHAVLVGHLPDGEVFNTGFWLDGPAPITDAEATIFAGQIATRINGSAFLSAAKTLMSADAAYDSVRVYGYATAGAPATGIGEAAIVAGAGTAGTGTGTPLQIALVATLLTASSSRSGRGRMYLPVIAGAQFASHYVIDSSATAVSAGLALLFDALNAGLPSNHVVVMSATHSIVHPVTSVRVDNRADVQRRRANDQAATFTSVSVLT